MSRLGIIFDRLDTPVPAGAAPCPCQMAIALNSRCPPTTIIMAVSTTIQVGRAPRVRARWIGRSGCVDTPRV